MTTQISTQNIQPTSLATLEGPKITNIQITNSGGTVLDDTAVALTGGYIKLTGSGFQSGCQLKVAGALATSVTFISATEVRAQVAAASAGTYDVYFTNPDGSTAIRINGLTYSATPTWVTASSLPNQQVDVAISVQLEATGATTYSLQAGSSLPAGVTLSSGGLISGTVTGISEETTYNFTVEAIDNELQDSPRAFSVTVTILVLDPYFNLTTLLLPGNGTNNATNNTFLDSSPNNLVITREGNVTQGTFSPFSPTGWSNFIGTNSSKISITSAGTYQANGNYTLEGWVMWNEMANDWNGFFGLGNGTWMAANTLTLLANKTSKLIRFATDNQFDDFYFTSLTNNGWTDGVWYHIAFVRSGGSYRMYLNGEQSTAAVSATDSFTTSTAYVGDTDQSNGINGYVSNLRFTESAVYTSSFTPSATPLSAISGTKLLTCQSNRFVDNSATGATFTITNDVSVQTFSPFAPAAAWSAATYGGSGYFDGNDYLTFGSTALDFDGSFTCEAWIYLTGRGNGVFGGGGAATGGPLNQQFNVNDDGSVSFIITDGTVCTAAAGTVKLREWTHIAWVRSGTSCAIMVNGNRVATGTSSGIAKIRMIGWIGYNNGQFNFNGYYGGARMTNTAVYNPAQSTYTMPSSPFNVISGTQFLLNYTNAGILDATAKNDIETVGNSKISTTQSKWGGSSMYFDGSSYASIANNDLLNLGSGDFTIEFWIYPVIWNSSTAGVVGKKASDSTSGWQIYRNSTNASKMSARLGSTNDFYTTSNIITETWTYWALVRTGSTLYWFKNGVLDATGSSSANISDTTNLYIGWGQTWGAYGNFYMQDLRITKGLARYTTNFNPPAQAFPLL